MPDVGAFIRIEVEGLERVQADLRRLVQAVDDLRPLWRDVGEYLLRSTHERFSRQVSPEGQPWAPLSPVTLARKKRNADKILIESGALRDLLRYQAHSDQMEFGTDRIYGAVHQFGETAAEGRGSRHRRGGAWGDIPARPYIGLSRDDEREIEQIVADHLLDVLS